MKRKQENFRNDPVTESLLEAVIKKTGNDKSKNIRAAIHYYANYILGQEEVRNIELEHYFNGEL